MCVVNVLLLLFQLLNDWSVIFNILHSHTTLLIMCKLVFKIKLKYVYTRDVSIIHYIELWDILTWKLDKCYVYI